MGSPLVSCSFGVAGNARLSAKPLASFSAAVVLAAPNGMTDDPIDCIWSVIGSGRIARTKSDLFEMAVASSARRNELSQIPAVESTDRGSWAAKSVVKLIAPGNAWQPENGCVRDQ